MIKIRTKNTVDYAQALQFEEEQGDNGIRKENILSRDPSIWELRVGLSSINAEQFKAPVVWMQKQTYETGDPNSPEGTRSVIMFRENFSLKMEDVQLIWEAIDGQILATDNLCEKLDEFVEIGVMHWIGQIRQVFGLDETGFEKVE